MTPRPARRSGSRRLLGFGLLFMALTAAGLGVVYHQFADSQVAFDRRLLTPGTIATLTLVLLAYFASDALRLHYTLRALGDRLPLPALARLVFINLFVSNITPLATGGGFAQVWYMRRYGVTIGRGVAATTLRTVLAIAFIFTLTPVALLALPGLRQGPLLNEIGLALSLCIALYLAFFATVLLRPRWLAGPLGGGLSGLRRLRLISRNREARWHFRMRREVLRFARSFGHYLRGAPQHVALSVLFTATFLLSLFSIPAVLIDALGHDVDYLTSLGLMNVTTFLMYFAPTPGASGISEGVFGSFFRDIIGHQHLLLVTISWRALTIYLGMLIGMVILQRELARRGTRPS